jgi:imidazolonepropionase-like amidohydrolase
MKVSNGKSENRDKQLKLLEDAFKEARAYWKAKDAESSENIPHHKTDIRWEAMGPVLKKEVPVIVSARGIKEIQTAIAWAEREDLRLILESGHDAWRIADTLVEKKIPVIVRGTQNLNMRSWERHDTAFTLPAKLQKAGVQFCIGHYSDDDRVCNLPYQAASAAAYGLPKDEALKTVTLYPAEIMGVADRVGSLEVGKDATLIITDGNPLEIRTKIEKMFIQGRDVDLSSKHTQLYEKYKIKNERARK